MDVNGSPEYVLTWKRWDMLSGPPICALRARARRTSDSAFSGWPTCTKQDAASSGVMNYPTTATHHSGLTLTDAARLAGYPTPGATVIDPKPDGIKTSGRTPQDPQVGLADVAMLFAGYPTPQHADGERGSLTMTRGEGNPTLLGMARLVGYASPRSSDADKNVRSPEGALREAERKGACNDLGTTSMLFSAETAKPVASRLNPRFSLWLMGFPPEGENCAPAAMPSSRKSRRSSSGR